MDQVRVEAFDVAFSQAALTPLATLSALVSLGILVLSMVEQVRQWRRGVRGAGLIVAGFVAFEACAAEEIAVAAGALDFIYLAEVGYLALVIPVIAQFLRRFTEDAHRLRALTDTLGDEVVRKTAERDSAREALAAQARFTALGRMAGGVGHEINNPLQVLTMRLEELHESLAGRTPEEREAVENCIAATQRIERIVDGMRAFALPSGVAAVRLAPVELARDALEQARPQLTGIDEVRTDFQPAPMVLVDRERVTSAIVQALSNAIVALQLAAGPRRIELATCTADDGDAVIAVRDSGAGFPAELLTRLGEPFLTTRPTPRSAGLGLFIIRGVVEAHGGSLTLENAPDGGAVVRIRLRPAR